MIDEKRLVERLNKLKDKCWDRAKKENDKNFARKQMDIGQIIGIINNQSKIGVWIPCSERLPEEHDSIFAKLKGTDKWSNAMFEKTSNEVNATIEFEDGKRAVKTLHTIDGRWSEGHRGVKFKVVAWQPLPEEYHG